MAILKPCGHVGCTKIVNEGVVYCNKHQKEYEEKQREKYKRYKRRRMHDEEQKKYQKFYTSKEWKRIREMAIRDTLAIDVIDYYKLNKITQGEIVHHIFEVSEDYNKRLNKDNLIYLTARNHKIVHNEYNNGNKAKMQELLLDLKGRFMDEFGLS